MQLASEVGELMSEYRWVTNENADTHSQQPAPRARIIEEIGDVGIALVMKNYPVKTSRGRAERPGRE